MKKNPKNATDSDSDAIAPVTGVHCERHAGVQKNTHAHELKHAKFLNVKELILLESDSNVTIACNDKHVQAHVELPIPCEWKQMGV